MKSNLQKLLALIIGGQILCSCVPSAAQPTQTPIAIASPTETRIPIRATFPARPTVPFITDIPPNSLPNSESPTTIPLSIVTPTKTPFDEELYFQHPLSIEHLRGGEYPGSTITIEQELEPGSNYRQYYVSYRSEGLKIYALMTVPNGDAPDDGWPVIIFNHGYIPPNQYWTTERYVEYIDALASSNYIVFRSDYRGHGLSEGEARGAYGFPDYTIDVLNAIASVKRYGNADPNRIGMWGHSMGGYITLRCMVISRDIKVGVIWAGVVAPYPDMVYNWPHNVIETPEIANDWRTSLVAMYGSPAENPAFWDAISANSYLTLLSGPIQLQYGTGDVEVPVEFSTDLYRQLLAVSVPVELYTYDNGNHNLSNYFDLAMKRTIETFDLYLKD